MVAAKIGTVVRMLDGMASLPLGSEAELLADPRMVAAGESYLRRALEALFDLGRHLLAGDERHVVATAAQLRSTIALSADPHSEGLSVTIAATLGKARYSLKADGTFAVTGDQRGQAAPTETAMLPAAKVQEVVRTIVTPHSRP